MALANVIAPPQNIIKKEVSGTTNSYGDTDLGLDSSYIVLSVTALDNNGGVFAIPRQIANGNWYATVYSRNAIYANTSTTLQVYYTTA